MRYAIWAAGPDTWCGISKASAQPSSGWTSRLPWWSKRDNFNPGIRFQVGDMLALDLPDRYLAGIVAFYAIVNIPKEILPTVFGEMLRVLHAGGRLLLAFHIGDDAAHYDELWGRPICIDFFYFQPVAIRQMLEGVGFTIEEVVEREPYAPEVEHQSRRAYIWARRP